MCKSTREEKGSFRTEPIHSECVCLFVSFSQADVLKTDLDKAISADFGDFKPRKSIRTQTTDTK